MIGQGRQEGYEGRHHSFSGRLCWFTSASWWSLLVVSLSSTSQSVSPSKAIHWCTITKILVGRSPLKENTQLQGLLAAIGARKRAAKVLRCCTQLVVVTSPSSSTSRVKKQISSDTNTSTLRNSTRERERFNESKNSKRADRSSISQSSDPRGRRLLRRSPSSDSRYGTFRLINSSSSVWPAQPPPVLTGANTARNSFLSSSWRAEDGDQFCGWLLGGSASARWEGVMGGAKSMLALQRCLAFSTWLIRQPRSFSSSWLNNSRHAKLLNSVLTIPYPAANFPPPPSLSPIFQAFHDDSVTQDEQRPREAGSYLDYFSLVFLFDVGEECRVGKVRLATGTNEGTILALRGRAFRSATVH